MKAVELKPGCNARPELVVSTAAPTALADQRSRREIECWWRNHLGRVNCGRSMEGKAILRPIWSIPAPRREQFFLDI
jgi:hypothetical protein